MAERKTILLVSYYFAPQNAIGAIRPTKLAKYLARMGYHVTVLCGEGMTGLTDPILARDLQGMQDVHVLREWNPLRSHYARKRRVEEAAATPPSDRGDEAGGISPLASQRRRGFRHLVVDTVYRALWHASDRSFARQGSLALRRMGRQFDVVLSSYGPLSVHRIARKAKQEGIAKRWIADFRDPVEPPFRWMKGYQKRYVESVKSYADELMAASQGYLAVMEMDALGHAVINGFDAEDLKGISVKARPKGDALQFVYCGKLFRGQRDFSPLFRALSELVQEGGVERQALALDFAGPDQDAEVLREQAAAWGMEAMVHSHGVVPRDEALGMQLSGDILLVAGWNTPEKQGHLPGKLLEVLMLQKPVVVCVKGSIPHSEAAELVERTGIGFCFEEAGGEAAHTQLKAYVKTLCDAHAKEQPIPFSPNQQEVDAFAYPHIATRVAGLVEESGNVCK